MNELNMADMARVSGGNAAGGAAIELLGGRVGGMGDIAPGRRVGGVGDPLLGGRVGGVGDPRLGGPAGGIPGGSPAGVSLSGGGTGINPIVA